MPRKRKIVPSLLTSINLVAGFVAILLNDPFLSFLCICIGIGFDFIDGLSARLLKVPSMFGKELDSLADMVTFGVAPGYLYFYNVLMPYHDPTGLVYMFAVTALFPLCAALRLAKFNVLPSSDDNSFIGMPSSAAALFLAYMPFLLFNQSHDPIVASLSNSVAGYIVPAVLAGFMVLPMPMFSFKGLSPKLNENIYQAIFVTGSVLVLLLWPWWVIPISTGLYVLISLVKIVSKH